MFGDMDAVVSHNHKVALQLRNAAAERCRNIGIHRQGINVHPIVRGKKHVGTAGGETVERLAAIGLDGCRKGSESLIVEHTHRLAAQGRAFAPGPAQF